MKPKFITTNYIKNKETNPKLYIETDTPVKLFAIKISKRELKKFIENNLIKTTEKNELIQTIFYHF